MSDRELLAGYVDTWWRSIADLVRLLEELEPDEWARPTDLPGWDVKAAASHTAHLESVLAGEPEETADVGEPSHVIDVMGLYTEIGVVNRRDRDPAEIVEEIRRAARKRYDALQADMPTDGSAKPTRVFGGVPWDWRTLLRNRPLDVWMHEQDIRRATDRPGNMDSAGAQHTADYLTDAFGYVVGKRVAPPAGTTAVLSVQGSTPVAVEVGDDGRARRLTVEPDAPTVRIAMDRASFIVLAGGRRAADPAAIAIEGDEQLGRRILDMLATTP
ncbi:MULTISPECIES: maleylpyruvate isomerase family mycothiol-dependent enzyme [Nocardioides]|uniref:Maleylpyruvate isomerase family mycothiol-dependent enzyme n=1 Tax=Nocardioides vastitatis TaxID=2568655 RepID=A0ABW0ZJF7_9ACTN|nr:maleylpyruvate isomerase family mycothiol-dependent enzyme [Nocardioides sp.]THJ00308.1 maleylpyruvate isomerase family mycothiol-dependent enzyme [Nocardioides sp.]